MDQILAADLIEQKYHPASRAFTRVASEEVRQLLNLSRPFPDDIWEQWNVIEEELAKKNLLMFPPLPEAQEGEDVRVYRKDASVTQLLEAMLFPSGQNDSVLAKAISALHAQQARQNQPRRPVHSPERGQARPSETRTQQNNSGQDFGHQRKPRFDRSNRNRHHGKRANASQAGGGGGNRRNRRNGERQAPSDRSANSDWTAASANYQDFDRRANRPLA